MKDLKTSEAQRRASKKWDAANKKMTRAEPKAGVKSM